MKTLALALALAPSLALAEMPPKHFEHEYMGALAEYRVPLGRAASKCNALARQFGQPATHPMKIEGRPLYGCAYPFKGECFIVWSFDPSGRDPHMASNVRRHEIAHCNGWEHK